MYPGTICTSAFTSANAPVELKRASLWPKRPGNESIEDRRGGGHWLKRIVTRVRLHGSSQLDRAFGPRCHDSRDAGQQKTAEATLPAGREENAVWFPLIGYPQNDLGRLSFPDHGRGKGRGAIQIISDEPVEGFCTFYRFV